jgi:hypothetical protein
MQVLLSSTRMHILLMMMMIVVFRLGVVNYNWRWWIVNVFVAFEKVLSLALVALSIAIMVMMVVVLLLLLPHL